MDSQVARRRFLSTNAAAMGAAVWSTALNPAAASLTDEVAVPLRMGIIGVGGRGSYLMKVFLSQGGEVPAVCDIRPNRAEAAATAVAEARDGRRPDVYTQSPTDYRRMLERDDLDAVLIATPMQAHAVMAVDALRADKHVLSEVAAAVTLDECWELVRAAEASDRIYMLSENCCYWRNVLAVQEMLQRGLFGVPTFAECGYVHDCRSLAFEPDGSLTWRGELKRDRRGNLYPTHALGPVARWLGIHRGDRMVSLVAAETGRAAMRHFVEKQFPPDHPARQVEFRVADSTTVLIRTAKGALIDLRYDVLSSRPHPSTVYYALQGTSGAYDSRIDSIYLEDRSEKYAWQEAGPLLAEFDAPLWREHEEEAAKTGHAGGDFFVLQQFCQAVRQGCSSPLDVYDAAAWSAVIPLSEMSLAQGGVPVEFPDFTGGKWETAIL